MPRRPTVIHINHNGFQHEEAFLSKADALEWERMILDTLAMPQAASLNLAAYAAGLAGSVRGYGGGYVRNAWLSGLSTHEQWAKGDPVTGYEIMLRIKTWTCPASADGLISKFQRSP